jgi:hypothetical protein
VRGRLRFTDDNGNAADPAPFPSMVVIYNNGKKEMSGECSRCRNDYKKDKLKDFKEDT